MTCWLGIIISEQSELTSDIHKNFVQNDIFKGAHLGGAYAPSLFCLPRFGRQICPKSLFAVQIDPQKVGDFCLPRPGNQVQSFVVEVGSNILRNSPPRPVLHPYFLVPMGALVNNNNILNFQRSRS